MPKVPAYTLAWSPTTAAYELYETRNQKVLRIVPGSPEWFAWLEQVSSFAFVGKRGHYTARKEAKQRGGRYWSAYLAKGEHLTKKYLGKSADLTLARLEHIAGTLHPQSESQLPPPETLASVSTDGEVDDTQRPLLAQHGTPLHPLLATKLHVPRPRMKLVPRAHLVKRLQKGVERALTLVSAPAGFGKTTVLAQWCAQSGLPVAWLSLESQDNDPTRFLSYLIAALQTLDVQIGMTALGLLRTPQPPLPEAVLAVLVSEVTSRDIENFALVLDDYHVITDQSIQHGVTFLLEHLPTQLHLILAARADPPLPLARLRVQGQLTEVRTADLLFGAAEAGTFLQTVMGLELAPETVATLQNRTEGWIVGLQLAALSLQGRTDVSAFLAAFTGSHRYVLDYLSDEVLVRQPASLRQFLLHTCILERLSGSLCDAVREQEGSQAVLEALERANLFVVPLDDERGWYRYHHLFAEVLRNRMQQAEPTLWPALHSRASAWYEQHDLPVEAVQHALAAPDIERAARLIEPIAPSVGLTGQLATALGWVNVLPEALVQTRPFLCVYHALLLTLSNQLEAAEARLQDAERGIQAEMPAEQVRTIQGWVLALRGSIAGYAGDILRAISLARQALELLSETEMLPRVIATLAVAFAFQEHGDVTLATEREIAAADAFVRTSNMPFAAVSGITLLARLYVLRGRLRLAVATYAQVVQVVSRPEILQTIFRSLSYYFGLGDLLREWNDLEAAERHLAQGMALINETRAVEPFVATRGYIALARLEQARGNARAAHATLDTLAQLAEQRHFVPHLVAQVAAVRAQLELANGNLAAAIRWADSSGLSLDDENLRYPREGEYLALARVRIAQARNDPAAPFRQDVLHLLDRLQESADVKARTSSVLEILIVRALAPTSPASTTSTKKNCEPVQNNRRIQCRAKRWPLRRGGWHGQPPSDAPPFRGHGATASLNPFVRAFEGGQPCQNV